VGTLVVVAPEAARADPSGRPAIHVDADPGSLMRALLARLAERGDDAWLRAWRGADAAARAAVDAILDASDEPFEGRIARDLFAVLPDGATLFAGSSMPIRDLDAYAFPRPEGAIRVVANRGASGIDGSVSTALGVSAAAAGPTVALLGDLTLLHDAGALVWSARRGQDVVFVVPNNHGGGIFDHLAIAGEPEHERLFVTPHAVDMAELAAVAGAGYARVGRGSLLADAVTTVVGRSGVHLVEVPVDRSEGVRIRERVREAVREAVAVP
jgi:2-succinyl-5-enolpyruvyl-6-hydroxy-3-cyclohexene-1-carboxylate synthase